MINTLVRRLKLVSLVEAWVTTNLLTLIDWGDTLSITVNNLMEDNGTSIHWHGIRQLNSVGEDGVNGITECMKQHLF